MRFAALCINVVSFCCVLQRFGAHSLENELILWYGRPRAGVRRADSSFGNMGPEEEKKEVVGGKQIQRAGQTDGGTRQQAARRAWAVERE